MVLATIGVCVDESDFPTITFMLSISFMVGIVIGGAGTVTRAIYGAIFIGLVPDYASEISKAVPWALYGCCLIACVFLMPEGIQGVISRVAMPYHRAARAWPNS